MDNEFDLALESLNTATDLFTQADQARAYISITETQGPSQQLIDFINYDGGIKSEMGLESFDSFSTSTQHELLLSNLKPADLDGLGLESMSGSINKIANWLMTGGAIGFIASALKHAKTPTVSGLVIGGISFGVLTTASLVKSANAIINGVYPYAKYKKFEDNLPKAIAMDKDLAEHLPTTFTKDVWDAYVKYWDETWDVTAPGLIHKWNFMYGVSTKGRVTVDVAGWTPDNFKDAAKTLVDAVEKMHAEELKYADKLEKITQWVDHTAAGGSDEDRKLAKLINVATGKSVKALRETRELINWLGTELNRAGRQFEVADKD